MWKIHIIDDERSVNAVHRIPKITRKRWIKSCIECKAKLLRFKRFQFFPNGKHFQWIDNTMHEYAIKFCSSAFLTFTQNGVLTLLAQLCKAPSVVWVFRQRHLPHYWILQLYSFSCVRFIHLVYVFFSSFARNPWKIRWPAEMKNHQTQYNLVEHFSTIHSIGESAELFCHCISVPVSLLSI